ncbi:hypothetical protein [Yinghuangia seranimata]|uniref:hypothetical protein n=1 Tax=Yinghuangia seranimata TaxID=408067 RepID=UPI00248C758E|nr:hypothetical protein [Yinghuangia seranimata]MDI2127948.1 hypothetical protein [Yinghuangia seranimata]
MTNPDDRVARMVEDARRRREQQTADRAAFAAARAAGLRSRHAQKLARLRGDLTDPESLDEPDDDDPGPTPA